MNVADALRAATQRLSDTSDTARLDAELLMAHALGVSRSDMLLRHMQGQAPSAYEAMVARRALHEPVAYILGSQEFFGRSFAVTPDVLIPRGDSESVIEAALELASNANRILDLGTGSGALLITALLELPQATGIAIDASRAALEVAEANAAAFDLVDERARFLCRNWREQGWADDLGTFDLILCNPPYVEEEAPLDPDVRDHEPAAALFAGADGLDDYRALIPQLRSLLSPQGIAIFEIGAAQADPVGAIAKEHGFSVQIGSDLANRPRIAVLR